MRAFFVCLVLAFACVPATAQTLGNEQLLASLSEHDAAEARWILVADIFAVGAVGIEGDLLRSTIAYQRLLRARQVSVFEALLRSQSDVAACFGIAGLAELDAQRLLSALPALVVRERPVRHVSGSIGTDTTVVQEVLRRLAAVESGKRNDQVRQARALWLDRVANLEPNVRPETNSAFMKLLGLVPPLKPGATQAHIDAEDWLRMLTRAMPDRERLALLEAAQSTDRPVLQELAIRTLVARHTGEHGDNYLPRRVWDRTLEDRDALALLLSSRRWEVIAFEIREGRRESPAKELLECQWQSLTDNDWAWLAAHESASVRKSAATLRANPIAGWRVDEPPTQESGWLGVWLLYAMKKATEKGDMAERAAHLVRSEVQRSPDAFLAIQRHRTEWVIEGDLVAPYLGLSPTHTSVIVRAKPLAHCVFGIRLAHELWVAERCANKDAPDLLKEAGIISAMNRLWEAAATPGAWEARGALQLLLDDVADEDPRAVRLRKEQASWCLELAELLVQNPRAMPPQIDPSWGVPIYEDSTSRAVVLIESIYTGRDWFLPDDELPREEPKDDVDLPPDRLLKDMRAALEKAK